MSGSWSTGIPTLINVDPVVVHVIAGPLEVVVRHDGGLLLGPGGTGVGLVDDAVIPATSAISTVLTIMEHIPRLAVICVTYSVRSCDALCFAHQEAFSLSNLNYNNVLTNCNYNLSFDF